jgi:hypothetical protein
MTLGFIIPLKSKIVSTDWTVTCGLLDQTLKSLKNQTSQDFVVIVVGHEKPDLSIEWNQQYQFASSPFTLASLKIKPGTEIHSYLDINYNTDKLQKLAVGLQILALACPDYYMMLDADDILHKEFVSYVGNTKAANGYIARLGYEYYLKQRKLIASENLHKICGSTTVIHHSHMLVPQTLDEAGVGSMIWSKISHADMEDVFLRSGTPLQPMPFPSVLYVLNHGQNASNEFRRKTKHYLRTTLKIILKGRRIPARIAQDFGLRTEHSQEA